MALWTTSYPVDAGDRDPAFCWPDHDAASVGADGHGDIFSQFLDFEAGVSNGESQHAHTVVGSDPFFLDPLAQHPPLDGSASSGVSTADDFDFLSGSSHIGPSTTTNYEIDPSALTLFGEKTISQTDLEKLEAISLHSPIKAEPRSEPQSPILAAATSTLTNTKTRRAAAGAAATRKSKKLVDVLSSTIRKATTMRKTRRGAATTASEMEAAEIDRPGSPTLQSPLKAVKQRSATAAARRVQTQHNPVPRMPDSPPLQCDTGIVFVHGLSDDPFTGDVSPTHTAPMRYYSQGGLGTPMDSPTRKSEPDLHQHQAALLQWQHHQQQNGISPSAQEQPPWDYTFANGQTWWDKNVDANMAMHAQHTQLPYDYSQVQNTTGLMIHMPQPRPPVVNDLSLTAQTYLPPPSQAQIAADQRASRPPKAPSAGARHRNMSSSPMRKQRGPSASPTPASGSGAGSGSGPGSAQRQSRHSSGGSVSSQRSASGRLPGSMPGTPCSVRKRRSVTGTMNNSAIDDSPLPAPGGGLSIGFVNFTPNDGTVLMTGVAPSGSSKTKARREKEAQEKRRRLSEAALKAVAAAGGDVEKLRQQGFEF